MVHFAPQLRSHITGYGFVSAVNIAHVKYQVVRTYTVERSQVTRSVGWCQCVRAIEAHNLCTEGHRKFKFGELVAHNVCNS